MQNFEYASPTTIEGSHGAARRKLGRRAGAGRRHGPHQPDEGLRRDARSGS